MGWWSKKKDTDSSSGDSKAMVAQDPRTRVKTTSAATATTDTAVQNATIFNSNTNTVTYQSTKRTVTHTQQARVTEMITRRTPTNAELEELFAQMKMGGGATTSSTTKTTTTRMRPHNLNTLAIRSTPSFKHTNSSSPLSTLAYKYEYTIPSPEGATGGKRGSTIVKTEQTTFSEKNGRSVTQHLETQRVKLKPTWPPTTKPATTTKTTTTKTTTATATPKPYVSPYASAQLAITSSTKPYTSPYASSSTGAIPKRSVSTGFDAQGAMPKPLTITALPVTSAKGKLKPAHVYIFNHEKFDNKNEYRAGSAKDVKELRSCFEQFKCKVEVITNATLATVRSTVHKLELYDFTDRSALVIVILSHGTRHDMIAAKDGDYSLDDTVLFPILRNRTLHNKPKLLFVQACKGAMERGGFSTDAARPHGSPNEILKCYSTFEGYVSFRTSDGTPFIQTLTEAMQREGRTRDIEGIMEQVRRVVKAQTQDNQIPSVTSTLTSKYVFGDYI